MLPGHGDHLPMETSETHEIVVNEIVASDEGVTIAYCD